MFLQDLLLSYMETAKKKATKSQSLISGTKSGKVSITMHAITYSESHLSIISVSRVFIKGIHDVCSFSAIIPMLIFTGKADGRGHFPDAATCTCGCVGRHNTMVCRYIYLQFKFLSIILPLTHI